MTINFLSSSQEKYRVKERYFISEFDSDTYQIIDSIENREICVCSNEYDWEDAKERAEKIASLLHENLTRS